MGSPLGPVLANLFMGYHERNWLQKFDIGEVPLDRRYVDDIFCLFRNEIDAENFFKYLNSKHPNIKFTMEKKASKFLPFLDVLVKKEGRIFTTSAYRKKTAVGLFMQYNSFTPFSYKIGLNFFKYLNSKHPNIKFTMEKKASKFLPFLDVLVKNEGRIFTTSMYRKKTAVGIFTQYNSFTPFTYKIGLIKCFGS